MKYSSKVFIVLIPLLLSGIALMAFTYRPAQHITPVAGKESADLTKKAPTKLEKQFIHARGLHVTGWIAGGKNSFQRLVDLCNKTELNALCIDIKDSDGVISFDTTVPLERQIHASRKCIGDIHSVMATMKANNIYPIARIAVFKDPILANAVPSMGVQRIGGGLWKDNHGTPWANPYDRRVWDYNIALATECVKLGFKEIQWDYVRFPSDGRISQCVYPEKTKASEAEVVANFLKYAREKLEPQGVVMSADIFGLTSIVKHDMGIGQRINMMAKHLDYICPMVYPSHYALGEYGIPNPNKAPYKIARLSLGDAVKQVKGTKCKIRPWLQDFSLYGVHYGAAEVLAQRKAAREVGLTEFLLWNPGVKYTRAALANEKAQSKTASAKR